MAGRFKLVEDGKWLRTYSDGEIEIKVRDMGDGWRVEDVEIDVKSLKPGGPSYNVVMTPAGFNVTGQPGFPMRFMRPARIDMAIVQLQGMNLAIGNLEGFLREIFPGAPIADYP